MRGKLTIFILFALILLITFIPVESHHRTDCYAVSLSNHDEAYCRNCQSDWQPTVGTCQTDNTITTTYTDSNLCNKPETQPDDEIIVCDFCTPNWQPVVGPCKSDNFIITNYEDLNNCNEPETQPEDEITTCDYCIPNYQSSDSECRSDNTFLRTYEDINNCNEGSPNDEILPCDFCTPDWQPEESQCGLDDTITTTYVDNNNCNEPETQPVDNISACNYCTSSYQQIISECDQNDLIHYFFEYDNSCCSDTGLVSDCDIPKDYTEPCDYCTPNIISTDSACRADDTILRSYSDLNNCGENLPEDELIPCDFCVPNWQESVSECGPDDLKVYSYLDLNNCNEYDTEPEPKTEPCNFCTSIYNLTSSDCQSDDLIYFTWEYTNDCCSTTSLESDCDIQNDYTQSCDFCSPNWQPVIGTCQADDTITTTYVDINICNEPQTQPQDETESCDFCSPNWTPQESACNYENTKTISYLDSNNCNEPQTQPLDEIVSCDYCVPNWQPIVGTCQTDDTITTTYSDFNNCNEPLTRPDSQTTTCNYCTSSYGLTMSDCQIDNLIYFTWEYTNNCCSTTSLNSDCDISEDYTQSCDYCTPNIISTDSACRADDTILRSYSDLNNCGENLPEDELIPCDYCTPNWQPQTGNCQADDTINTTYSDSNNCNENDSKPADESNPCDFCTPNYVLDITWSECINNIQTKSYSDLNNCNEPKDSLTRNCIPKINNNLFDGDTTDLTTIEDLSNAPNIILEKTNYGKIEFLDNIDLTGDLDLDSLIIIDDQVISFDTEKLQGLNVRAKLFFYNVENIQPIYYNEGFGIENGIECPTNLCSELTLNQNTLSFIVEHFTTFYTFTIYEVSNQQVPISNAGPDQNIVINSLVQLDGSQSTDPNGDNLAYKWLQTDGQNVVVSDWNKQKITFTPTFAERYEFTLKVFDGLYWSELDYVVINVNHQNSLSIEDLDVKVDDKSDKNVKDGDKISVKAEPGSNVEFDFKIKNENDFEELQDVKIEISIKDIDDGSDVYEDTNKFNLDPNDDHDETLKLKIPSNANRGDYDILVKVEGYINNKLYLITWDLELEVERDSPNDYNNTAELISFHNLKLSNQILECTRKTRLDFKMINLDSEEIKNVRVVLTNNDLRIISEINDITLSDTEYEGSYDLTIPLKQKNGTYKLELNAYSEGSILGDSEKINLYIDTCQDGISENDDKESEEIPITLFTAPNNQPPSNTQTSLIIAQPNTNPGFFNRNPDLYLLTLVILSIIFLGAFTFLAMIVIVKYPKKKLYSYNSPRRSRIHN